MDKLSELKDVEYKGACSFLAPYGPSTNRYVDHKTVIHMIDRTGHTHADKFRLVTTCNRVVDFWETHDLRLIERLAAMPNGDDGEPDGYKLCNHCGTPADFKRAVAVRREWDARRKEKDAAKEAAENKAREERYAVIQAATSALEHALQAEGFLTRKVTTARNWSDNGLFIFFQDEWFTVTHYGKEPLLESNK